MRRRQRWAAEGKKCDEAERRWTKTKVILDLWQTDTDNDSVHISDENI